MGKIIQVAFYRTESGREPVREWLSEMSIQEKKSISADIRAVEMGWPMGLPNGTIKKEQKTPKEDLELAKRRRNESFRGRSNEQ